MADSSIGPAAGFDYLFAAALHEIVSILMKGIER